MINFTETEIARIINGLFFTQTERNVEETETIVEKLNKLKI